MGKKRMRHAGSSRAASNGSDGAANATLHSQSLADEVLEVRDAEFAAEKKQSDRAKRQKLSAEQEFKDAKRAEKQAKLKLRKSKTVNARTASLKEYNRAVAKRKDLEKVVAGDVPVEQESDEEGAAVDAKTTARILKAAQAQQEEISREEKLTNPGSAKAFSILNKVGSSGAHRDIAVFRDSSDEESSDDEADSDSDVAAPQESTPVVEKKSDVVMASDGDLQFLDGTQVTEADELALSMFDNAASAGADDENETEGAEPRGPMIVDFIMEKIREQEEAAARAAAEAADPEWAAREKKIAEVYDLVGKIMSRYRSGKVPKAFKVIPKLKNWEKLIYLTRPDSWTPAATFMATRILSSNLTAKEVERFYCDILLPRCLEDIEENKKLNYHHYQALQKAAYKPDAFNKGILFPLCEYRGCTLRQATVIGSVLSKVSIPMLHSAAALMYVCEQPWSPTNSIFISVLLEKGYALPYRVIDALVEHFVKMKADTRSLPVMWHRCLLAFAQRYKMDIEEAQKEQLKLLMRVQFHAQVTPEVRRELFSARSRGEKVDPDVNMVARAIADSA